MVKTTALSSSQGNMSYSQDMINSMCVSASVSLPLPCCCCPWWYDLHDDRKIYQGKAPDLADGMNFLFAYSMRRCRKKDVLMCCDEEGFPRLRFIQFWHCSAHCFCFDVVNRFALMFKRLLDGRPDSFSWPCCRPLGCVSLTPPETKGSGVHRHLERPLL